MAYSEPMYLLLNDVTMSYISEGFIREFSTTIITM